jgi:Co/Zn/Cd efflux system component
MFADASVYLISLYAIGRSNNLKRKAAKFSGILQTVLAFFVVFEVGRRFIFGSEPLSLLMMTVGCLALIANAICLTLISKHKDDGIHMRASVIFSANDVIANIGVILSGILVLIFKSRYPDLIIGLIIAALVFRGGIRIINESQKESKQSKTQSCG